MSTQSAINWPEKYIPGFTDNYVSNKIIVNDLSVDDVWPYLSNIAHWANAKGVEFVASAPGQAARLSWTAKQGGSPKEKLDILHA